MHHLEVLGLLVRDLVDAGVGALVDHGVGIGHQDRRVGGDHELRAVLYQVVDAGQQRELALR